jgi:fructose-specific component phosphotransferase system IIB-like protein
VFLLAQLIQQLAAQSTVKTVINAYYIGAAAGNTGSTTTGDSLAGVAVSASATVSTPVTGSAAFRIVGIVPESAVTVAASATSSNVTITLASANASIVPGMVVSGPGILNGSNTYVTAVSGTAVTINTAVTSAQATAAQFSFTGFPEVLVAWNAGYHSYNNATGV